MATPKKIDKSKQSRQYLWESIKHGMSAGLVDPVYLDEIEMGFYDGFFEGLWGSLCEKMERVYDEKMGEEVREEFYEYCQEIGRRTIDPSFNFLMSRIVLLEEVPGLLELMIAANVTYVGFKDVGDQYRHCFNMLVTSHAPGKRRTQKRVDFYFEWNNEDVEKEFDDFLQASFLGYYDATQDLNFKSFVDKAFHWPAFEEYMEEVAKVKRAEVEEKKTKAVVAKAKFSEDVAAYEKLQKKLKKAGVI